MSITYNEQEKRFVIETKNTAYAMKVELDRYLVHVYYGERTENIPDKSVIPVRRKIFIQPSYARISRL